MGYAYYTLPDGREAGYGVRAKCDAEGCTKQIDRGLGYLCGDMPDGWRDSDKPGCGNYFCGDHEGDHNCPNPNGWDEDGNQKPYIEDGWLAKARAKANDIPDPDAVARVVVPFNAENWRFEYGDGREPYVVSR